MARRIVFFTALLWLFFLGLPLLFSLPPSPPLEAKIGQMLMVGFRGLELSPGHPVLQDIRERNLGGVILFDLDGPTQSPLGNVASAAQLKRLVATLQQASAVPLLVAVDQEGGYVARLKPKHGFPRTVSARTLGQRDNPDWTRRKAAELAEPLAEAGINLNLAPVVDLDSNPQNPVIARYRRSFSPDPQVVTRQAAAFIEGHHARGVLCALKHFPGHGSSRHDSHHGLTDITDTWQPQELEPYRQLIASGQVDAIMTAHVFDRQRDPRFPATLSKATVTGLLRQQLGFDGVVISDDLQMGAIGDHYSRDEVLFRAIDAGVDILVIGNNSRFEKDAGGRAVTRIAEMVRSGRISESRIDASWKRINLLKEKLNP